jgi:FtsP/CotA-like multicopper oxidase with cupredoxin domain
LPDTIYSTFERNVTVRVKPDKFTGYALVHCHYVIHADRGMMAEIELRAPPPVGENPALNEDPM